MCVLEVIESRVWINKHTGQRVSIYGALPWTTKADAGNWEMVTQGFTWRMDNGTVGLGRAPASTREEAEVVMRRINGEAVS